MIFIPIEPVPLARARLHVLRGKNGLPLMDEQTGRVKMRGYTPKASDRAKVQIARFLKGKVSLIPKGTPIIVRLTFHLTRPPSVSVKKRLWPAVRPDLDNYVKLVLDAARGIAWEDDSQITTLTASKRYGQPGIELEIEEEGLLI